MEGVDKDLRDHIKEQLLSAKPIFRDGKTALERAVASGLGGVVARLLATCPFLINEEAQGKMTILHIAAREGHAAISAQLLSVSPALAEARTYEDLMTPLHFAASGGHAEIVAQLLITNPASIDAVTNVGWTALHWAAVNGHAPIVAQLLATKPELIEARAGNGWTALHCAVNAQHEEVVTKLLVAKLVSIEAKANDGRTVLQLAANHEGITARLIAAQSLLDYMVDDFDGWNALRNVVELDHVEAIERVLARHPNLIHEASPDRGWTVFHYVASHGRDKLMSRLLAAVRQPDLEQLLLRKSPKSTGKMDFSATSSTALHMAAAKGNCSIIEQLLTACPASIDVLDESGGTCLHSAAAGKCESAVRFLLAFKPALIHAVDAKGNTILHFVLDHRKELVESVWKLNPAALHAVNDFGRTPFWILVNDGNDSVIDLVQGSLTFEEIERTYNQFMQMKFLLVKNSDGERKFHEKFRVRFVERFTPLLERQCEELAVELLPDVVAIVFEYLGLELRNKIAKPPLEGIKGEGSSLF